MLHVTKLNKSCLISKSGDVRTMTVAKVERCDLSGGDCGTAGLKLLLRTLCHLMCCFRNLKLHMTHCCRCVSLLDPAQTMCGSVSHRGSSAWKTTASAASQRYLCAATALIRPCHSWHSPCNPCCSCMKSYAPPS